MPMYQMKLIYAVNILPVTINDISVHLGINNIFPVLISEIAIEQTVPFIPDEDVLQKYANIIINKINTSKKDIFAKSATFLRYDYLREISNDSADNK